MKKYFLVIAVVLSMVTGCGTPETEDKTETSKITEKHESTVVENENVSEETEIKKEQETANTLKGYVFEYNGVKIGIDMEAAEIIAALGEADSYFEAPSCAFEGLDKTYSYSGFEIDTYEKDGKDYISCVFLRDDMIETPEGISLYMSKDDMIRVYGEVYTEEFGMYVYEKDGMKLRFILTGDEITSIEYTSTVLEVQ